MSHTYDAIVIGSGAAGVHVALPLVEAGLRVLMLDGGVAAPPIIRTPTGGGFAELRKRSYEQIRWFVGEDLSLLCSNIELSGMVGGNRNFVSRYTKELLPLSTEHEDILQTLAEGGLASAWGGACTYFDDATLRMLGLPPQEMRRAYEEVTHVIGVSGPQTFPSVQPPPRPDHHARALLAAAARRAKRLALLHATVQQPHTAALTEALGSRRACTYNDLEYYSDTDQSLYRASFTLAMLRQHACFTYRPSVRIERIEERDGAVHAHGHLFSDGRTTTAVHEQGRTAIIAAGAVGTGRILLASLRLHETPIPLVSMPHVFTACLHPRTLGRAGDNRRSSLCQVLATIPPGTDHGGICAQLYSYRSFLLYRLLPLSPFPIPESLQILRLLTPSLIVAGIRLESTSANGMLALGKDGTLSVHIPDSMKSNARCRRALRNMKRVLRVIGLLPFRTKYMPEGSAYHYAGTVPITTDGAAFLSADSSGRVRQFHRTYVADASLFPMLPAEPHTLTIMANARRIGQKLSVRLRNTSCTPPP